MTRKQLCVLIMPRAVNVVLNGAFLYAGKTSDAFSRRADICYRFGAPFDGCVSSWKTSVHHEVGAW